MVFCCTPSFIQPIYRTATAASFSSSTLFGLFPFLKKLFADGGYQGPQFQEALAKALPQLNVEIVKRSDQAKGFEVLPKRWIVERTFAWLSRCRRLAKDFENLTRTALTFVKLASIRIMLRRLCNPSSRPCADDETTPAKSCSDFFHVTQCDAAVAWRVPIRRILRKANSFHVAQKARRTCRARCI